MELTGELDAAAAQVERFEQQRQSVIAEVEQIDTESAVLAELTAIRALVGGEAGNGAREGVDAFGAALLRLFESFELLRCRTRDGRLTVDLGTAHDDSPGFPHRALTVETDYALYPHVRQDVITGWDDRESFPALRRAALTLGANIANTLVT